jgi:hypothetical protein
LRKKETEKGKNIQKEKETVRYTNGPTKETDRKEMNRQIAGERTQSVADTQLLAEVCVCVREREERTEESENECLNEYFCKHLILG